MKENILKQSTNSFALLVNIEPFFFKEMEGSFDKISELLFTRNCWKRNMEIQLATCMKHLKDEFQQNCILK